MQITNFAPTLNGRYPILCTDVQVVAYVRSAVLCAQTQRWQPMYRASYSAQTRAQNTFGHYNFFIFIFSYQNSLSNWKEWRNNFSQDLMVRYGGLNISYHSCLYDYKVRNMYYEGIVFKHSPPTRSLVTPLGVTSIFIPLLPITLILTILSNVTFCQLNSQFFKTIGRVFFNCPFIVLK